MNYFLIPHEDGTWDVRKEGANRDSYSGLSSLSAAKNAAKRIRRRSSCCKRSWWKNWILGRFVIHNFLHRKGKFTLHLEHIFAV